MAPPSPSSHPRSAQSLYRPTTAVLYVDDFFCQAGEIWRGTQGVAITTCIGCIIVVGFAIRQCVRTRSVSIAENVEDHSKRVKVSNGCSSFTLTPTPQVICYLYCCCHSNVQRETLQSTYLLVIVRMIVKKSSAIIMILY